MAPLARKAAWYHWRIHSGSEVDLILERDGMLYPIEVKLNSRPSRKDSRGIRAFRETYPNQPIAPGLVIAPAEQVEQISENEAVVPWDLV
jgi:predicted AAA+ superfamily ATPase